MKINEKLMWRRNRRSGPLCDLVEVTWVRRAGANRGAVMDGPILRVVGLKHLYTYRNGKTVCLANPRITNEPNST